LMKQHRLVLDPSNVNAPQLRFIDLTGNHVRWTQTLGSVQQNFPFFQYLNQQTQPNNQQAQANNAYNPNAKFRFYQVKGNLMVFQVGAMVYCLDADSSKILWQQNLLEGSPNMMPQPNPFQPNMMIQRVMADQDGYLEFILWNQFNNQQTRTPIGHVG